MNKWMDGQMDKCVIKQIEQTVNWLWNLGGDLWVFTFSFPACWKIVFMEKVVAEMSFAVWVIFYRSKGREISLSAVGSHRKQRLN